MLLLDHEVVETPLDAILIAVSNLSGSPVSYQRLYDISSTGAEGLIAYYD